MTEVHHYGFLTRIKKYFFPTAYDKAQKNALSAGGLKTKIFQWAFNQGNKKRLLDEDGKQPGKSKLYEFPNL